MPTGQQDLLLLCLSVCQHVQAPLLRGVRLPLAGGGAPAPPALRLRGQGRGQVPEGPERNLGGGDAQERVRLPILAGTGCIKSSLSKQLLLCGKVSCKLPEKKNIVHALHYVFLCGARQSWLGQHAPDVNMY